MRTQKEIYDDIKWFKKALKELREGFKYHPTIITLEQLEQEHIYSSKLVDCYLEYDNS